MSFRETDEEESYQQHDNDDNDNENDDADADDDDNDDDDDPTNLMKPLVNKKERSSLLALEIESNHSRPNTRTRRRGTSTRPEQQQEEQGRQGKLRNIRRTEDERKYSTTTTTKMAWLCMNYKIILLSIIVCGIVIIPLIGGNLLIRQQETENDKNKSNTTTTTNDTYPWFMKKTENHKETNMNNNKNPSKTSSSSLSSSICNGIPKQTFDDMFELFRNDAYNRRNQDDGDDDDDESSSSLLCDPTLIVSSQQQNDEENDDEESTTTTTIRKSCQCNNPLIAEPLQNTKEYPTSGDLWYHANNLAKERIYNITKEKREKQALQNQDDVYDDPFDVDVAFMGDSIIEHWIGLGLGIPKSKYQNVTKIYNQLFTKNSNYQQQRNNDNVDDDDNDDTDDHHDNDHNGKLQGVVLGISGQRCRNVLYQLQNGLFSVPSSLSSNPQDKDNEETITNNKEEFTPKVIWLLIGTNDLGSEGCSANAIIVGIIAIVREIQQQRPNSIIVVNSILPREEKYNYWQYIAPINERIACYASMTKGVEFFNASSPTSSSTTNDLFPLPPPPPPKKKLTKTKTTTTITNENDDDDYYYYYDIMSKYFVDQLHPNEYGYRVWGNAIVDTILKLI